MKKPKTFQLQPHKGALPLELGTLRADVRALCGDPVKETPKYDYFHRSGLMVEYKKDRAIFIQISRGFGLVARYGDVDVLAVAADEVIKLVSTDAPYDRNHPELGCTYRFPSLSITFWRPRCPTTPSDAEACFFKTVAIAVDGYWVC